MILKRLALAVGAPIMLASTLAVTAPPATAADSPKTLATKIVKLTNKDRAKHKVKAVKQNKCLKSYAQRQAKRQAAKKKMYHQNLMPALKKCKMNTVGENVAFGFTTAKSVEKGWMNSPGHRANILNKRYNRIGTGVAKGKDGYYYYATVFGRAR